MSPLGNCAGTATPPVTDENYNISVDNSCGFTAGSSLNNVTAAELNLDPLGLQNNGGPSYTVALESGSDAIDRIPVANCTEQDYMTPWKPTSGSLAGPILPTLTPATAAHMSLVRLGLTR